MARHKKYKKQTDKHFVAFAKEKSGPVVYLNPKTFKPENEKEAKKFAATDGFLKTYEWRSWLS